MFLQTQSAETVSISQQQSQMQGSSFLAQDNQKHKKLSHSVLNHLNSGNKSAMKKITLF